jgi:hypothetical protein
MHRNGEAALQSFVHMEQREERKVVENAGKSHYFL